MDAKGRPMIPTRRAFLGGLGIAPLIAFAREGQRASAAAKRCIHLHLTGGPSQLDTWDPKPNAPSNIRGPFRGIPTNVPGISISELFPKMARTADQYAIIRSMHNPGVEPVHPDTLPPSTGRWTHLALEPNWDAHGWSPYCSLKDYAGIVAPAFDHYFTTLLSDLQSRGLLETTLVVATGEFGRTPKLNPAGGRDHWPECWSMLVAGAGVRGGQVIGESNKWAAEPKDRPVTPAEIDATIQYAIGAAPSAAALPVWELFR